MMNIQSFVLFLCIGAAFAQPRRPATDVEILNEHFAEPVIIDNPDAAITLLPANHAGYLYEHLTAQGRDWTVLGHHPLVKIKMTINGSPVGTPSSLDSSPVIVEFDRLENSNRPKTGTLYISWNAVAGDLGVLRLNSFANNPSGPHKLHWRRVPDSRSIVARGGEKYRVRLVRFQDATGASQCFPTNCQPITGEPTVKVSICTSGNLSACN